MLYELEPSSSRRLCPLVALLPRPISRAAWSNRLLPSERERVVRAPRVIPCPDQPLRRRKFPASLRLAPEVLAAPDLDEDARPSHSGRLRTTMAQRAGQVDRYVAICTRPPVLPGRCARFRHDSQRGGARQG